MSRGRTTAAPGRNGVVPPDDGRAAASIPPFTIVGADAPGRGRATNGADMLRRYERT